VTHTMLSPRSARRQQLARSKKWVASRGAPAAGQAERAKRLGAVDALVREVMDEQHAARAEEDAAGAVARGEVNGHQAREPVCDAKMMWAANVG
jgi:hypothetical protein